MKNYFKFWYMLGLLTFLFCSDESTKNPVDNGSYQKAIIFFDKTIESFVEADTPYNSSLININGSITADELPEIEYIKLGDSLCTNFFDYQYNPGQITFKNKLGIIAIQETLSIEVESSHGIMAGEIVLPDELVNINYSFIDSLKKGDSLVVSWEKLNSDFYIVEFSYYYEDFENRLQRIKSDTLTELNSFMIKSTILNYDGDLFVRVYPVNGPYPEKGAFSNMQGGFLYAINRGSIDLIKVGKGLSLTPPLQKKIIENGELGDKKKLILSRLFEK